jgi:enoyl-CoA hydratase
LTPAALSRAVLLAETFTPTNGVDNGLIDRVVATEAELLPVAMEFAKLSASLNATAHSASKQRLRGEAIAAIQSGLTKDLVGWKKLFIKN